MYSDLFFICCGDYVSELIACVLLLSNTAILCCSIVLSVLIMLFRFDTAPASPSNSPYQSKWPAMDGSNTSPSKSLFWSLEISISLTKQQSLCQSKWSTTGCPSTLPSKNQQSTRTPTVRLVFFILCHGIII